MTFLPKPFIFSIYLLLFTATLTASAGEKKLRVAFGDNRSMPTRLLNAGDLVCALATLDSARTIRK